MSPRRRFVIRIAASGRIATLTLDRPAARNALRIADWKALAQTVHSIDPSIRALVIRGEGGFCAGADLREMAQLQDDAAMRGRFRETMHAAIETVAACPVPVIAAVGGGCYGAGVALAIAADIRIAGRDAVFATTPARVGIGYPAGDVARLIARIGRGQAARMLFAAQPVDAGEALRIGLVEQLADDPVMAAQVLAETIAANAPGAVALLKRVIADPSDRGHDAAFDAMFGAAAFAEGLAAFAARRKPDFR